MRPAFVELATSVWRGETAAVKVLEAIRQAMNPESKNRGAIFNHALKGQGIKWRGSRP
jgi:hypothetical protein